MQTNECFMCGGDNFTVTDGAYVCNECGIQSQSVREVQISFADNKGACDENVDKDHEVTAGTKMETTKKLLSWECYNLILLGLTNEMIQLGAKPSLKLIVLQLWVRYLQCIEAAFTSKKFAKLPKINTSIVNVDGQILYGVENIKRKLLSSKTGIEYKKRRKKTRRYTNKNKSLKSFDSNASSTMTNSQKKSRVTRRLRSLDHSAMNSNNDSTGRSDNVSLLQKSTKSSKVKVKLSKNLKKTLKSMPSTTNNYTDEELSGIFQSGQKRWNRLKKRGEKNLKMKKVIAIIRLALMINNDDIYVSDIIRWIHEGHFHVNRVNLFLPKNATHGVRLIVTNTSRLELNLELNHLLHHLEIKQLPNVDLQKLVTRFCDELQLPNDFTQFVHKIVLLCPPDTKLKKVLPDIEIKVMAYILFAAKFLFCLDGVAENLSSDFAKKVNKSNKEDKKLFNWNDYVKYIECRNSVVAEYNYVLHKDLYGNNIRNTQLFINDWNIMKSTIPFIKKESNLSKHFIENTECLFNSMPDIEGKGSYREIPASTKPLSSTLKWIFEYYPTQLTAKTKKILEQNFIETDVLYLTNEKRIYDLAKKCDVPIKVNHNVPLHYEKQAKQNYNKSLLFHRPTRVHLLNEPTSVNKHKHNETSDNTRKEKPCTIFLGTGVNYWCIHISKRFLTNTSNAKVETVFKKLFPISFLWFMRQCCRMLDCHLNKVYWELIHVEEDLLSLLKEN